MKRRIQEADTREFSYVEDLSELETHLADSLDIISDLQDKYFDDDELFGMLIRCHDLIIKAKNKISSFTE